MLLRCVLVAAAVLLVGCNGESINSPGGGPLAFFYITTENLQTGYPTLDATAERMVANLGLSYYYNPNSALRDRTALVPMTSFPIAPSDYPAPPEGHRQITGHFFVEEDYVELRSAITQSEKPENSVNVRITFSREGIQELVDDLQRLSTDLPEDGVFSELFVTGSAEIDGDWDGHDILMDSPVIVRVYRSIIGVS